MKSKMALIMAVFVLGGCGAESESEGANCASHTEVNSDAYDGATGVLRAVLNACNRIENIYVSDKYIYHISVSSQSTFLRNKGHFGDSFDYCKPYGDGSKCNLYRYDGNTNEFYGPDGTIKSDDKWHRYLMDEAKSLSKGAKKTLEKTTYSDLMALIQ